mgnify:CR=1 FL=1
MKKLSLFIIIGMLALFPGHSHAKQKGDLMDKKPKNAETAIFAGGCFWCIESEFRGQPGVLYTVAGYMGGQTPDPTYQDVSKGTTGHAEVVQVYYDPKKTSYEKLLIFFMIKAHDPTQLNKQGVDVGTQYRSAIFYQDTRQKNIAKESIAQLEGADIFDKPIVTTIEHAEDFWPAEDYHQQYYEKYKEKTGEDHIRVQYKKQQKAKKNR